MTRREITRQRKRFKIAAGTVNCTGRFRVIAVEVRLLSAASVASEALQMLSSTTLLSCSRLYLGFCHPSQFDLRCCRSFLALEMVTHVK